MTFTELYALADAEGRALLDERAAIIEYDGNLSRTEAEQQATAQLQSAIIAPGPANPASALPFPLPHPATAD